MRRRTMEGIGATVARFRVSKRASGKMPQSAAFDGPVRLWGALLGPVRSASLSAFMHRAGLLCDATFLSSEETETVENIPECLPPQRVAPVNTPPPAYRNSGYHGGAQLQGGVE